jgi:hypothetical protein
MATSTMTSLTTFPAIPPAIDNQFLETWIRIGSVYKDAMDDSAQGLVISSAQIIQEHTMRAFVAAAQSCAEALMQNAARVQQQSIARFSTANQKAAEIVGRAWVDAVTVVPRVAR